MPNYARKRTYVLPLVAVAVVAAPVAAGFLAGDGQFRFSNDSEADVLRPTGTTQVGLAGAPRVVLPLRELAGMPLPDLKVADLRLVPGAPPLPEGSRVGPIGLVTAAGAAPISARTPALDPGVVPEQLADRVGVQVTELTNGSRFSMVGLTAPDLAGVTAMVRARQLDGSWGPWFEAGTDDSVSARRPGSGRIQGSEPVYVGDTDAVQILSTRKPTDTAEPGSRGPTPVAGPDHFGLAVPEMSAVLLDPGPGEEGGFNWSLQHYCCSDCRCSVIASAGVRHPRTFLGRLLSVWATAESSSGLHLERSVPFGKYCLRSPFVFSFVPRCHGL